MGSPNPPSLYGPMPMPPGPGFTHVFNDSMGRPQAQVHEPDTEGYNRRIGEILAAMNRGGEAQTGIQLAAMRERGETARARLAAETELAKTGLQIRADQAAASGQLPGDLYDRLQGFINPPKPLSQEQFGQAVAAEKARDLATGQDNLSAALTNKLSMPLDEESLLQMIRDQNVPLDYKIWAQRKLMQIQLARGKKERENLLLRAKQRPYKTPPRGADEQAFDSRWVPLY